MTREEILLKEYEACQKHNDSLGQQAWVSISIIITVNLLVLAQILSIFVKPVPWWALVLLIPLGLLMILVLITFKRWDKRIDFMKLLNNERMREIETVLEMWKNWRVYGSDILNRKARGDPQAEKEWAILLQEQREYIEHLRKRLTEKGWSYQPPTTEKEFQIRRWKWRFLPILNIKWKFDWMFDILAVVWVIVILIAVVSLILWGFGVT
jgi:hypothetical protein